LSAALSDALSQVGGVVTSVAHDRAIDPKSVTVSKGVR